MLLQRTEWFFWIFLTRLRGRERWDYLFCVPLFNHLKNGISSLKFKLFWIKNVGEIIIQHDLFIELKILQHLESSLKLFIYSVCVTDYVCMHMCVCMDMLTCTYPEVTKKSQELVLSTIKVPQFELRQSGLTMNTFTRWLSSGLKILGSW